MTIMVQFLIIRITTVHGITVERSLSYASRTIPDIFNLRIDKAFMKYSVEVRLLPKKKLAEFTSLFQYG